MQLARYGFAARLCKDRDVLEVACGAGCGLGYLLQKGARSVVGGDISASMIRVAASHYESRIPLLRLDAASLPFKAESFDVLLLFEALYYIDDQDRFVAEAKRVLRPGGCLVICCVNSQWLDFNPSLYSTRYLSAGELEGLLAAHGFRVHIYAGFRVDRDGARSAVTSMLKRAARNTRLIPRTMKGKQWLKRVFLGRLQYPPHELSDGLVKYHPPLPITALKDVSEFKVIYASGMR
jgi:ubiquinone/menaquinone biosynthesis C-methylase UbiE